MAEVPDYLAEDVQSLKTRITALEQYVHDELSPMLHENTRVTSVTSAMVDEIHTAFLHPQTGVKVRNDAMYEKYKAASNAIDLLVRAGNGAVNMSEKAGKIAKGAIYIGLLVTSVWGSFHSDKMLDVILKLLP